MRGERGRSNRLAHFGTSISHASIAHSRALRQPLSQFMPKRATGPLATKEKFCAVLRSFGSDRAIAAYDELHHRAPHALKDFDFEQEDVATALNRILKAAKHPVAWTADHAGGKAKPVSAGPEASLDPADWDVPVARCPTPGAASISLVDASEFNHWQARPDQPEPQAFV
eukprot:15452309-Alexandrium_andersonii.AAC.1